MRAPPPIWEKQASHGLCLQVPPRVRRRAGEPYRARSSKTTAPPRRRARDFSLLMALLAMIATACHAPESRSARDVRLSENTVEGGGVVRQSELQEDLERFATRFMEAVVEAATPLSGGDADTKTREVALRRVLLYTSSALDIATSASPEIALLDMLVFVGLSRRTLERHWIPTTFGERGQPLLDAFVEQENDLWEVSGKVLSLDQQLELRVLIDDWVRDNPDKVRVEAIRLSDFSAIAGKLSAKRAEEARGLLGSVKSATIAADDALLLGERAVFMSHRMPFLVRLQARLGASEITTDALHRVDGMKALVDEIPELRPLATELQALTHDSKATLVEAQLALRALKPILEQLPPVLAQIPPQAELQTTIGAARLLTEQTGALIGQARALLPAKPGEILPSVTAAADRTVRRWALYLVLIGAAWSLFFWGGYYVFKRLTTESGRAASFAQRSADDCDTERDHPAPPHH